MPRPERESLPPAAPESLAPAAPGLLAPAAPGLLAPAAPGLLAPAAPGLLAPAAPGLLPPAVPESLPPAALELLAPAAPELLPPAVPESLPPPAPESLPPAARESPPRASSSVRSWPSWVRSAARSGRTASTKSWKVVRLAQVRWRTLSRLGGSMPRISWPSWTAGPGSPVGGATSRYLSETGPREDTKMSARAGTFQTLSSSIATVSATPTSPPRLPGLPWGTGAMDSTRPIGRPATTSAACSRRPAVWRNVTRMRVGEPRVARSRRKTKTPMAVAITAMVTAPTRRASALSGAPVTLLLPEELPWIALEVAEQLAQVAVELVARQQRSRGALACAQVTDCLLY